MGHIRSPLYDRDDELAAVAQALDRGAAGRGSLVVIEGPAGSGKSGLAAAARDQAASAGVRELLARGGELERDYPFGVVRQLFEPLLVAADDDERARLLAGAAAPAAWALGLSERGSGVYAAGFGALNAVYWLTARLAAQGPLLLWVDDAHWADASSLRALDYLARRIDELPVALVVALRPEEPGAPSALLDELRTAAGSVRLALAGLRATSVAAIVRERMKEASAEACAACHAVTAGNPFYLQELLRALPADAPLDPSAVRRAAVPSLADRVMRRAARVAGDAPALTRAMAVLGDGERLATAAALAGLSEADAVDIAHRLRRIEVLAGEDPIAFQHPLVRGSVYDAMPASERRSAHRRAAGMLEAAGAPVEAIAPHLQVLEPDADPAVAGMLLVAAERALEHAAVDEAIDLLRRALAEHAAEPPRGRLLARLGAARAVLRDPAAIADLREAYALAVDARSRGEVAVMLAELLAHAGQWDAAIGMIEAVEAELEEAEPDLRAEIAAVRAAATLFDPARVAEFDAHRATYVALAREDHWASFAIAALLATEAAHRGRPHEAEAFAERALAGGRLIGERGAGSWTPSYVIGAFAEAEILERALETVEIVHAASEAAGAVLGQLTAIGLRGWVHARRGDLATAESELLTALALAEQSAMLMGVTTLAYLFGDVLIEREGLGAVEELVEHVELAPDFLNTASGAMLLEVRGRLRLLRRDHGRGLADLRAAGATFTTLRFGPAFSSWRSTLALGLPAAEAGAARMLAEEELELARATGLDRPIGVALRALGILAERSSGLDLLQGSVDVLAGSPARYEHARSLIELGSALRGANRRTDARRVLVRGLELADACGAQRLTRRGREELRGAGSRRTRIATSGLDSLTTSELRVVTLAAGGATNGEIAQALYVSLKTVETHLSHAYGKLGLAGRGSRARLAELL